MSRIMVRIACLSAVVVGLLDSPASSAELMYEPFNYTSGTALAGKVNANGQTWSYVGTGAANSADPTIGSGNLTSTGLPAAPANSNSALTNSSQSGVSRINLPAPFTSG